MRRPPRIAAWRASLAREQIDSATKGGTHETIKHNPERVRVAGHGSFAARLGVDPHAPDTDRHPFRHRRTIDREKRVVNIKTPDGTFQTIDVPPAAKRFDELKVGDKVSITYNNTVSARLKPPGEAPVDTVSKTSTAGQGERPGGTAAMERTLTVTISAIDKGASSITFTGPNGWKYSRRVVDPTVLDKVKVGDQVDITWDTDVTVAVQ